MTDKTALDLKAIKEKVNELEEEMSVTTKNNIYIEDIRKSRKLLIYRYALLLQIKDIRRVRRKIETRIEKIESLKSQSARGRMLTERENQAIENVKEDIRRRDDIIELYDNKKEIYSDKRIAYAGIDAKLIETFYKHEEDFRPFLEITEKSVMQLKNELDQSNNFDKDDLNVEEVIAKNNDRYGDEIVEFDLGIIFNANNNVRSFINASIPYDVEELDLDSFNNYRNNFNNDNNSDEIKNEEININNENNNDIYENEKNIFYNRHNAIFHKKSNSPNHVEITEEGIKNTKIELLQRQIESLRKNYGDFENTHLSENEEKEEDILSQANGIDVQDNNEMLLNKEELCDENNEILSLDEEINDSIKQSNEKMITSTSYDNDDDIDDGENFVIDKSKQFEKENFLSDEDEISKKIESNKINTSDEVVFEKANKLILKTVKSVKDKIEIKKYLEEYLNKKGYNMTRNEYNESLINANLETQEEIDKVDLALTNDIYELGIILLLEKSLESSKNKDGEDDEAIKLLLNKIYQIRMQYEYCPGYCFNDVKEFDPEKVLNEIKKIKEGQITLEIPEIYKAARDFTFSIDDIKKRYINMYHFDNNLTSNSVNENEENVEM